jgi:hypothetical protein
MHEVRLGDSITFRAQVRDSNRKATRKVVGFARTGVIVTKYNGWNRFHVRSHEVLEVHSRAVTEYFEHKPATETGEHDTWVLKTNRNVFVEETDDSQYRVWAYDTLKDEMVRGVKISNLNGCLALALDMSGGVKRI